MHAHASVGSCISENRTGKDKTQQQQNTGASALSIPGPLRLFQFVHFNCKIQVYFLKHFEFNHCELSLNHTKSKLFNTSIQCMVLSYASILCAAMGSNARAFQFNSDSTTHLS